MIQLTPTGQAPVEFEGEKLCEHSSQGFQGPSQNRWYVIRVYQPTDRDDLVLEIEYRTQWQGEKGRTDVFLAPSKRVLYRHLQDYDPMKGVPLRPPGVSGAKRKNEVVRVAITQAWEELVSEVCATIGITGGLDGLEQVQAPVDDSSAEEAFQQGFQAGKQAILEQLQGILEKEGGSG